MVAITHLQVKSRPERKFRLADDPWKRKLRRNAILWDQGGLGCEFRRICFKLFLNFLNFIFGQNGSNSFSFLNNLVWFKKWNFKFKRKEKKRQGKNLNTISDYLELKQVTLIKFSFLSWVNGKHIQTPINFRL